MLTNLNKLSEHILNLDGKSDLKTIVQLLIDSNDELLAETFKRLNVGVDDLTDAQRILINGFNASINSWSVYKKKLERLDDSGDIGDLSLKPQQGAHKTKELKEQGDHGYFHMMKRQPPGGQLFETDHDSYDECVFIQGLIKDKQEKAEKDKTSELGL